jgi:RNA polymerase-associated protein CTR9
LACIAIDCGALKECAGWLKIAAETAPGNAEVLTLIGNLHLSLCDWAPAQQVFDGLLTKKVPNIEAYAMLSLGNIYFANLNLPGRYVKHLQYAADYYKRILTRDTENAYAANGLGTVLAEKAELFKAKEVFNRVREVSGDSIADAHLNLGHIYLAQKRHPEALQMYQSYLKRTEDGTAPITSKSRTDDKVDVLLYIAFAYFDWARQTELFNNAKAAPADERYKKAMEHLELALSENTSKNVVLTYNLCMTKLQAANCVLQKLTRNIRRSASEVEDALNGLQQSLQTVEEILKKKADASMKVPISTSMLNDFLTHCRSNIESAKSHLEDERKREEEANELRELQRLASESQRKQQLLQEQLKKEEDAKKQEARDRKVGTVGVRFYISCIATV